MGFCPMEKCQHYGEASKYPRKCYYEPQCWKGYLDLIIAVVTGRLARGSTQSKGGVISINMEKGGRLRSRGRRGVDHFPPARIPPAGVA